MIKKEKRICNREWKSLWNGPCLKYDDDRLYVWTVYSLGKVVREDELVQYAPHYISEDIMCKRFNHIKLDYLDHGRSSRWNYGSGFRSGHTQQRGTRDVDFQTGIDYDYIYANGTLQMLLGEYNSKRLPEYHRLDLSVKKEI